MLETGAFRSTRIEIPRRFYAPELDSLRFVAFLGVFTFHARQYLQAALPTALGSMIATIGGAGAFGVDLFFVLSAYLITELLLREKELTDELNVPAFYLRRILRIWPLYFFFLAIAFFLCFADPAQHFDWKYLTGYGLLSGNWMIILFGIPASVANPLWSISMEEQFYLCWPPLVGRLSMKGIGIAAAIMLVAANLIRMLLYVFIHPQNESIWFNTFTHLDPLALGVLLAVLLRTKRLSLNGRGRALVFGVSFVALLAVSRYAELNWNSAPLSTLGLFGYPAVALSCFGIVAATLGVSTRFVRSDALTYLGKISYGLYVYHLLGFWMAERLFRQLRGFHIVLYPIAALCFTIVLGSISYRFLESPFLRLKKRFTYVPSRPL